MKQHDLPKNLLETFIRQAGIIRPTSVLIIEFDNGTVNASLENAAIGKKRTSLVIASEQLHRSKKIKTSNFITIDEMYRLPFKKNIFDLVLCCGVLEHLKNPDKALSELYRITKHYTILSVPNEPKFRIANMLIGKDLVRAGDPSEHVQHWSGDMFEAFVSKKFTVFTKKEPFPWVVLVGEKN